MKATINDNASGIWTAEVGTEVEFLETSPNGRAATVKMPPRPRSLERYANRNVTIPTSWLDLDRDTCPTCGQQLPLELGA